MFDKLISKLKLFIEDVKWSERRKYGNTFNNCFPSISLDSYKPSFRAKHTPEEMQEIIRRDREALHRKLEKMLAEYTDREKNVT